MSLKDYTICCGSSQPHPITIKVDIRRNTNPDSTIKAHADVGLSMGPLGESMMFGFSVYSPEGKQPVVLPPAQKGKQRSFPYVSLRGQPISETARVRRLVIVRDGQLHLIPFDALVTPSGAYVLQTRTVQYAPSATTYYLLSQSPSRRNGQAKDLAALAVGGVPYSSTNLGAGDVTRGYNDRLMNLPSSIDEVLAVRAALGPSGIRVLKGSQATETAITAADLQTYDVMHLAVHGLSNTVYPDRAALVLLSNKSAGDDGFLQLPEIVQLKLKSDLVVLSACESAVGALQGQEGVSNLSRAFLLAGARTVVSSLWAIDDKSSLYLMRRFYSRIAKGQSFGLALREAKRDMLRDFGPNALPYNWAAFTLEGLGSARLSPTGFGVRSRER